MILNPEKNWRRAKANNKKGAEREKCITVTGGTD
jgi:hypothetical protein